MSKRWQMAHKVEFPEPQLETAHVLFTDIVGYSRLSADAQLEAVGRLQSIVQSLPGFAAAVNNERRGHQPHQIDEVLRATLTRECSPETEPGILPAQSGGRS